MRMNQQPMSGQGFFSVSFLWVDKLGVQPNDVDSQNGKISDHVDHELDGQKSDGQEFISKEFWKRKLAFLGEVYHSWTLGEILGSSKELRQAIAELQNFAQTNHTVLITGDKGVGMDVVARFIEESAHSSPQAFVRINCAAIPPSMLAAELFGHLEGGHSQGTQPHPPRPQLPPRPKLLYGLTILLDGVENLSRAAQLTLLRALEEMDSRSTPGSGLATNSTRLIVVTEADIQKAAAAGAFNRDLFSRLSRSPIRIPSLRERKEEIPVLVRSFLDRYAYAAGTSSQSISADAMELLQSYPWPGNLRELECVLERFVAHKEMGSFLVDAMSTRQKKMTARTWVRSTAVAQQVDDFELVETALIEAIAALSDRISETRWA
jgi:formate hydrogenlyase transcriptional activator